MHKLIKNKNTGAPVKLILASASAGRKGVLQKMGLDFVIDPANIDEEKFQVEHQAATVVQLVTILAQEKARVTAAKCRQQGEPGLIIAADTVVVFADKIIGKPKDVQDAQTMLYELVGNTHQVFTGLAVVELATQKMVQKVAVSDVTFRQLSDDEIIRYVATGEAMGKAGSYSSQEGGKDFIKQITGDYTNVIGLPQEKLLEAFAELGYEIAAENDGESA